MSALWIAVAALAVWRITHLLHAEAGPGNWVVRLRRAAGSGLLGQAMDCFHCLSLWLALPFAWLVGQGLEQTLLLWPALSAAAIAFDAAMQRLQPATARYFEDPVANGDADVQLSPPAAADAGAAAPGQAVGTALGNARRAGGRAGV